MHVRRSLVAAVAVLSLFVSAPTDASLIGDTVTLTWLRPVSGTILFGPIDFVVTTGGPELTIQQPQQFPRWDVDVRESSVRFDTRTLTQTTAPGDLDIVLEDLDYANPALRIVGVEFTKDGIVGVDASDVTFTGRSVTIDVSDAFWIQDLSFFEVTFLTAEVPEPSPMALATPAVLALAAWRGRRRSD